MRCNHSFTKFLWGKVDSKTHIISMPCKRNCCRVCGPMKIRAWKRHISNMLDAAEELGEVFYLANIQGGKLWETIRKQLRRADAEYMRVDRSPGLHGKDYRWQDWIICSTRAFTAEGVACRRVHVGEARVELFKAMTDAEGLAKMARMLATPFSSSRNWSVRRHKKPSEYENIGTTILAQVEVKQHLDEAGIPYAEELPKRGRYFRSKIVADMTREAASALCRSLENAMRKRQDADETVTVPSGIQTAYVGTVEEEFPVPDVPPEF